MGEALVHLERVPPGCGVRCTISVHVLWCTELVTGRIASATLAGP